MNNEQPTNKTDINKLFNLNNILSQLIEFSAYIIAIGSTLILAYLSFIDTLKIQIDWTTLGIFSGTAVLLSWLNWSTFYKRKYEQLMAEDILQNEEGKYSIHGRYYMAIKDWDDAELQMKIDSFNEEYVNKWLRWVEKKTGCPIKTEMREELDSDNKPILNEEGKPKLIEVKGILDRPYKGFKYKWLMWRIKTHHYPESGYKTSMELMSLLSFQDANLNKRELKADKKFYIKHSIIKLLSLVLTISVGGSIIPELIGGNYWTALLKFCVVIGSLITAILMGAMNGIRGARLKLSIVEDTCNDLERWAEKKPILGPYKEVIIEEPKQSIVSTQITLEEHISKNIQPLIKEEKPNEVTEAIFNIPKSSGK